MSVCLSVIFKIVIAMDHGHEGGAQRVILKITVPATGRARTSGQNNAGPDATRGRCGRVQLVYHK